MDLELTIKDKAKDNWPEADWLCLPFKIASPQFRVHRQLGVMNPATDILPGANRDLFTVGHGVTITDADGDTDTDVDTDIDTDVDTWDKVMAVNVRGVFLGCKYAIPQMLEQGSGSVINIAIFVAILGCSVPQDAYTASKGAVLALTRSLAVARLCSFCTPKGMS